MPGHVSSVAASLEDSVCTVLGDPQPPRNNLCAPTEKDSVDNWSDLKALRYNNVSNLIIGFNNINSIRNKYVCLKDILDDNLVDVFSVLETKIDDSFPDAQFKHPEYAITRQDCTSNSAGILTYVRSDIAHVRCQELEVNDTSLHSLCLELTIRKERWIIITLYRPPSSSTDDFWSSLYDMTERMLTKTDMIVIMGDVNINATQTAHSSKITDFLDSFTLTQLVNSPTCFKGTPSILDHVYVSKPRRFSSTVNFDCGLSDFHHVIAFSTKITVPKLKPKIKFYRSYKHFDESAFRTDLQNTPFHVADIFTDVDDSYWAFNQLLTDVANQHAPIKKKIIRYPEAPFMNSKLRKAMYQKRQACNKARKDPKNQLKWNEYSQKRNHFVSLRRSSMKSYFSERCSAGSQNRNFWQTLKPFFTNKGDNSDCSVLKDNNMVVTGAENIAKCFSDYFSTITDNIGISENFHGLSLSETLDKYKNHASVRFIQEKYNDKNFSFKTVTTDDVGKVMKLIDPRKATGHDQLPPKLLKLGTPVLTFPITKLINRIFSQMKFPTSFKKAELSPVYKSKSKSDKTNYRPISVLPCISIITERIINSQLCNYFNEIYNVNISAYRKSHNTECVVLNAVEDWKLKLDNGQHVAAVSTDLSKAFDVLPHGLILSKLKAYGIDNNAISLFHDYLNNRVQRVKIGNAKSSWTPVKKGVPQGSVLGPVLFNVFMNDIFHFVTDCTVFNYADDNVISCHSDNVSCLKTKMELNVCNLINWFTINGLKANPNKFQLISFGNSQSLPSINVSGINLECQPHIKYLGVMIDKKLSFETHIDYMCAKAGKQVNALLRLCNLLDYDTKLVMYKAFISSNFTYCPVVWSFCNKTSMTKLEKLQRRALRFVIGDFSISSSELLNLVNISPLSSIVVKKIAIAIFKCVNDISPKFLRERFTLRRLYNLRGTKQIFLRSPRTTSYGILSFAYLGAKIWNNLSNNAKEKTDLNDFKNVIYDVTDNGLKDDIWCYVVRK